MNQSPDLQTDRRPVVVAIDGPSGSGKSSTSRGVAQRLGFSYLDTGAMYRAAAWQVAQKGATCPELIAEVVAQARIDVVTDPAAFTISIDDVDVTEAIREPSISAQVSTVATVPAVRTDLVARQRAIIDQALADPGTGGIVVEGRDITTVVAPDADVRLLLVADPAARVARRQAELGQQVDNAAVTDQVIRRDRDDSTVSNFTEAAEGVTVLDSTALDLEQVIDRVCQLVTEATP